MRDIPNHAPTPTALLLAWGRGEQAAFDQLVALVHDELLLIARRHMRHERPGHSLQATALVNEAYIRLIDIKHVQWQNRAHFFAMSARVMRRILVDFARARGNEKRGGGVARISFDEALLVSEEPEQNLVALDEALQALETVHPRKSHVVELRFFGGLSLEETAEALHVSVDTVKRDFRFAKLWLLRELRESGRRRSEGYRASIHSGYRRPSFPLPRRSNLTASTCARGEPSAWSESRQAAQDGGRSRGRSTPQAPVHDCRFFRRPLRRVASAINRSSILSVVLICISMRALNNAAPEGRTHLGVETADAGDLLLHALGRPPELGADRRRRSR